MDIIFGTLTTDELKVVHHRANRTGIQHRYAMTPADPAPGDSVTLRVRIGVGVSATYVACYYTHDGTLPIGNRGVAQNGKVVLFQQLDTTWDTLTWNYQTLWQATLPPQVEGTLVRYRIGAWTDGTPEIFADWPDVKMTAEAAAGAFFQNRPIPKNLMLGDQDGVFAYHVDTFCPPDWAYEAIIYHVFVDRFYPGDGKTWLQTDDLNGICGGTLWGVRDKLEYIADLGATCLWLSPTWVSPSHHGYDAIDYDRVESRLGGDEALHALVEAAHARGIRVLLDLACNHISSDHPIFVDARNNPTSPYREWFHFDDSRIGYRTFFTAATMPQLNLAHPPARQWMIDIARYWLREFDVDGYRLDYANGPVPDFWVDFWRACKTEKPDCLCFGEIIDAPDTMPAYFGKLDGCLDFHLSDALRRTYGWQMWTEAEFERFAHRHQQYFPRNFLLPVFLDNHDMDRFLVIANGDKAALRRAATIQLSFPNPPVIFYGTEVGLSQPISTTSGAGLHVSRTPMLWGDDQDHELLAFYKTLIRNRTSIDRIPRFL